METLQRHLVFTGVSLILMGLTYGHAYSFFSNHEALLTIKDDYQRIFVDATDVLNKKDSSDALFKSIETTNTHSTQYRRAVGAHAHAINLGILIILIGLIFSFALQGNRYAHKIGYGLLVGGVCYPTGLALQAFGLILAGEAFALVGAGLVISCLIITLCCLFFKSGSSAA